MIPAAPPRLDITIPAYNVGANIPQTLHSIARGVVVGAPRFELGTPSPPDLRHNLSEVIGKHQ
jgi:hypothetical protein